MTSKKQEWFRVGLYTLISYGILWLISYVCFQYDDLIQNPHYALFSILLMFPPTVAMLLTRLLTREGWKDMFLQLCLRGHLKAYLLAAFLPMVYGIAAGLLCTLVFGSWSWEVWRQEHSLAEALGIGLYLTAMASALSFYALGEEFGWRAYLYPKLEKLIGTPATIIVGGIIWGAWHMPLTIQGHNFGTEYPGFPWLGIALMCAFCVSFGAILMWMTKKTNSIYPAGILHSVNNNVSLVMMTYFCVGIPEDLEQIPFVCMLLLPAFAVGIIFIILLYRDAKKGYPTS